MEEARARIPVTVIVAVLSFFGVTINCPLEPASAGWWRWSFPDRPATAARGGCCLLVTERSRPGRHEESDRCIVPMKPRTVPSDTSARRRRWREGGRSKEGRAATHAPDTAPDMACHWGGELFWWGIVLGCWPRQRAPPRQSWPTFRRGPRNAEATFVKCLHIRRIAVIELFENVTHG
jgi:hypothetical protein